MLTARGEAVDRIIGLEQGADDYLGKPFLPRELSARIEAVLRRRSAMPAGTPVAEGGQVSFGENVLDLSARTLFKEGVPVVMTSGEFSLLASFVQHPHRPLSRERLIELAVVLAARPTAEAWMCRSRGSGSSWSRIPPDRAISRPFGIRLRVCPGRHTTIPLRWRRFPQAASAPDRCLERLAVQRLVCLAAVAAGYLADNWNAYKPFSWVGNWL